MEKRLEIERKSVSENLPEKIEFFRGGEIFTYHEHWHDYYEWIFYYDCEAEGRLNSKTCRISDRTSVLLSPYDFHSTRVIANGSSSHHIRICFTRDALPWESPENGCYTEKIDAFLEHSLVAFEAADSEEREYLLAAMILHMKKYGTPIPDSHKDSSMKIVRDALKYMHNHFVSANLSNTAKACGVSSGYLSTVFPKYCGESFERTLTKIRLDYAKAELRSSKKKVTEIALDCGYGNFSNFLRTFKKYSGCTPTGYRKETSV